MDVPPAPATMAYFNAHAFMQDAVGASFSEQTAQMSIAEEPFFMAAVEELMKRSASSFPLVPWHRAARPPVARGLD